MCADGSPYSYWIHQGDPSKVVFFLQGGGACFDPATCAFDSGSYKTKIGAGDDPNNISTGIFDFANERNPLADYSFVFAPYCTGDVHLGNSTHVYGPNLTVQHKGSIDASTALKDLAAQFPDATQLVVTGESAGSVPTPLYAGLAHDLLPNADDHRARRRLGRLPRRSRNQRRDRLGVGHRERHSAVARECRPDGARLGASPGCSSRPTNTIPTSSSVATTTPSTGCRHSSPALPASHADDLVTLIDKNETQIEQGGVDLRSYIAPGNSHTVLSRPEFYTETVEGVPLVDWVTDLVRRQPDLDVHCTDCT